VRRRPALVRHARARVLKISRTWPWKGRVLGLLAAAVRPGRSPPDQPPRPCDPERVPTAARSEPVPTRAHRAAPPPAGNPLTRHHG
jgi:hypothetical protein